jgi:hypothetical protein
VRADSRDREYHPDGGNVAVRGGGATRAPFAAAVAGAGPAGLSFHGLREGFMVWAAESGATDAQLDAIVPRSDPRVRALAADQKALARGVMGKLTKPNG